MASRFRFAAVRAGRTIGVSRMPYIGLAFLALWLIWIGYWVASAWGNKRTVQQLNPVWRVGAVIVVVIVSFGMRANWTYFGRRWAEPNLTRDLVGLALTAAGVAFSIWARRTLGTNWSGNPTIKENHELIQSGPYRWIRHPIYTGILVAILGGNLADARIRDFYIFGLAVVMLVAKLKIEEKLMLQQFPEAYPAYRKRTKALVPFIF